MASKLIAFDTLDDDYIDMEVTSYSNFFCHSHSQQPREFEFQMSSIVQEKDSTTSPADELFYKGKLLPLHLPPRLQMVEKILQNSDPPFVKDKDEEAFEEFFSTPLGTTTYTTPITGTPFESCNISPVESCHVSRELNPQEYKLEFPAATETSSSHHQKKSWTKKLKHSSIGSKLRASRAYLKSWFGKSGCSYENYAASTKVADEGSVSKTNNNNNNNKENLNKKKKNIISNNPYGQIRYESSNCAIKNNRDDQSSHHRRSFSVGIKILSGNKSSLSTGSSSFSIPNKSRQHLKRCSSASSEIENAIQGAIAHCKKSHQQVKKKNASNEVGFYSFSEDQERVVLCRG